MNTVTVEMIACAGPYSGIGPAQLAKPTPEMAAELTYVSPAMFEYWADYTKVGTAQVTVTFLSKDEILTNKVEALRAEKSKVLAEAQRQANEIEERIQSLLAITYTPEVL